ncbi:MULTISPECIES: 2-oxoglutarate dehydrogenase E1 component [Halomonas]|uniref:oxoglutarate dehydrogenase (succinyl-transferring) n=2 Tax=Halomonas TaxID=2745 RepID=A0ABR4WS59_9GAMM|nr:MULTISPECIES: 2-oxoglutarate dehydrogenase E1 component [Halomonas]PSJ22106.1 2-oxoglutarate dehydrogenase E1 component [Halomonas sp. ND22Bw]KGE77566.1 2-oxoglutarate dehydrogenase [Halomonas salina]MDR5887932.1 2-oxoglutarate dehydrogenase E1 component [Halomonas salina]RAH38980.1 2-oxoglutarate dehydrogenase E1 component [Halomonas sp. SL1]WJY08461.1 2-oxoglutarate dehydrogenase E1 component [Halomonas halophila]
MQQGIMELMWRSSHVSGSNVHYVEALYEQYLDDPSAVPDEWRQYFDQLPRPDGSATQDVPLAPTREQFYQLGRQRRTAQTASAASESDENRKQVKVLQLINAYRFRGHQKADIDPLDLRSPTPVPDLDLSFHQLSKADLDTEFQTGSLFMGADKAPLKQIVEALEQTYCRSIGCEFMHIVDTEEKRWLQQRFESVRSAPTFSEDVRKHVFERLTAAEGLESYLASKYPGTKRFGLEGGESFIPMMDELIQRAGGYGTKEVVIGMAHRGRLNVLVNILGKNPSELIDEFDGKKLVERGSGDVKYHQGFSSNVMTPGGEVHLAMSFNPSHLEIVAPVVEGSVRARQDRRNDTDGGKVLPINVHGDAAFAGQGVVMETFQMSQTRAYRTGGTVHIVINNQVGFTTSHPEDSRSTEYCTDIAKMVQAPIFHVNGDDPDAVLHATQVALDYRQQFKKDVVIDLVCYRRRGHNEADEPSGTQPMMYSKIKNHPSSRALYAERLVKEGLYSEDEAKATMEGYRDDLVAGNHVANALVQKPNTALFVDWKPYLGHEWSGHTDTSFDMKRLQHLAARMCEVPDGVSVQRQVAKIYDDRRKMQAGGMACNWGFAETLAYATLLDQGHPIRLTGQDVGRGTFSHRHAVVHNQKDGSTFVPLQHLSDGQPRFTIHDSFLSEEAVLAFEYGYSTTAPNDLVIWEAQFGDFFNGAQVVVDQFISSGETKWERLCGLTMLLPHGYEGQGPEHSSARLERFLQLCAEHNMQVCVPTTPAQIFHLLRRQVIRKLRKPLVVMSPKSLLRHKDATSSLDELANGSFQMVIPDQGKRDADKVERIILCAGKVYYDLANWREENARDDVAILRLEQLYPFPEAELFEAIQAYTNASEMVWCQEEPLNQGAWYPSQHHMRSVAEQLKTGLGGKLKFAGRPASAAPAAGYMSVHTEQQRKLVEDAFNL